MVRVESPPTKRDIPVVRAALLPVVLMAGATAAGAVPVTGATRAAVVWCGAIATVVVAALTVVLNRRRRAMRVQRAEYEQRIAYLEHRIASYDQETVRLSKELLPAAIRRLRASNSPQEVMRDVVDADESYRNLPKAQRALVLQVLDIIDNEEAMRDSAQRAFVNVARRVQAIVHRQARELREMEDHHGRNPDVFDDLLRIDHGTALIGRLADSIAVLGGARPGRQWPKAVPLFSVLRGAMSRILDYQRVDLHSIAKVAIVGTGGRAAHPRLRRTAGQRHPLLAAADPGARHRGRGADRHRHRDRGRRRQPQRGGPRHGPSTCSPRPRPAST